MVGAEGDAHGDTDVALVFVIRVLGSDVAEFIVRQVVVDPHGDTVIVHPEIEGAALGVEESAECAEHVVGLLFDVGLHPIVGREDKAGFELGFDAFATDGFFLLAFACDVQQLVDAFQDVFVRLTEAVSAEQIGCHDHGCEFAHQLARALVCAIEQPVLFVGMPDAAEHVEHIEVFEQMSVGLTAVGAILLDLLGVRFVDAVIDRIEIQHAEQFTPLVVEGDELLAVGEFGEQPHGRYIVEATQQVFFAHGHMVQHEHEFVELFGREQRIGHKYLFFLGGCLLFVGAFAEMPCPIGHGTDLIEMHMIDNIHDFHGNETEPRGSQQRYAHDFPNQRTAGHFARILSPIVT